MSIIEGGRSLADPSLSPTLRGSGDVGLFEAGACRGFDQVGYGGRQPVHQVADHRPGRAEQGAVAVVVAFPGVRLGHQGAPAGGEERAAQAVAGDPPLLLINDADRTDYIRSKNDTTIRVKGKAKALGLKTGDNTIRIVNGDGPATNVFVLHI